MAERYTIRFTLVYNPLTGFWVPDDTLVDQVVAVSKAINPQHWTAVMRTIHHDVVELYEAWQHRNKNYKIAIDIDGVTVTIYLITPFQGLSWIFL